MIRTTGPSDRAGWRRRSSAAVVAVLAVLASACADDGNDAITADDSTTVAATDAPTTEPVSTEAPATTEAEDPVSAAEARVAAAKSGVAEAQGALTEARGQFCVDATGYVDTLDRYGKLFSDAEATVGDVTTGGADLVEPRASVRAAADSVAAAKDALAAADQELIDAEADLAEVIATASSVPNEAPAPEPATTTTLVPAATVDRVQLAEDDLARTAEGITDDTPLNQATAAYNSAAFALQIAWMQLLADAGCLTEGQQAEGVARVTEFTSRLQSDLQFVGYFNGVVDGIYGPDTVEAVQRLQADSSLRQTGFVDRATARALHDLVVAALKELGRQATAANLTHTASVQTVLRLTGFWPGAIDGEWTDELTAALQAFQTELGVPPTGEVDTATLIAFEQALAELERLATATTPPPTIPPPPTDAPEPTDPPKEPATTAPKPAPKPPTTTAPKAPPKAPETVPSSSEPETTDD